MMKWVGSFRTRPGTRKLLCRFHPNYILIYLRIKIFLYSFLFSLTIVNYDLFGQNTNSAFDTIKFVRHRYIGIDDYYQNTQIKNIVDSHLFAITTQFQFKSQGNINNGNLSSYMGFDDFFDGTYWIVQNGISTVETNVKCKVEMYCRGVPNQSEVGNRVDCGYNKVNEQYEPALAFGKGASGIIWIGDSLIGEVHMTHEPKNDADIYRWIKNMYLENDTQWSELPKYPIDFALECNFLNEDMTIIYSTQENHVYIFSERNLLALFHPEKKKFLEKKSNVENPLLFIREDLNEKEQIKILFLSMLSQWIMKEVHQL